MKYLFILALFIIGCLPACWSDESKNPTTVCYKLEICDSPLPHTSSRFNLYCVYGYDVSGNKNGEIQKFLSKDVMIDWAQLNPNVKSCN